MSLALREEHVDIVRHLLDRKAPVYKWVITQVLREGHTDIVALLKLYGY
uniref:Ankyrin repeat protein n=1 Tax=Pithovirus LCDPAC01 TaxID=2506600 RepID=A0A481YQ63_9VIRU|nr:MAG: hypothetical protein LCDPAC01_00340 [Pithovirus LCDPAC01]